jgi:hypothetical protein
VLEHMLVQAGIGTAKEIESVAEQEHGLGLFVRSLVGWTVALLNERSRTLSSGGN